MESQLDPWIGEIVVVILLGVSGYIVNWFRLRAKIMKKNELIILSNAANIVLLKKALIIALRIIDKQTEKAHGEDPEIACLIKDLLSDKSINGTNILK